MIFFEDELIVNNRSCDNDNCDCDASGSCTCASDECDSGGGNIFDDEDYCDSCDYGYYDDNDDNDDENK